MIADAYDRLRGLVGSNNIKIDQTTVKDNYVETDMSVTITNVTPAVVDLIANKFIELPITLRDIKFNVNQGLMSGSIEFTVVGAAEK